MCDRSKWLEAPSCPDSFRRMLLSGFRSVGAPGVPGSKPYRELSRRMSATRCAVFHRMPMPTESAPPVVSDLMVAVVENGLVRRDRSTTVKKCNRSRMIGPLSVKPYW